jgi:hypothetical protein
MIFKKAIIKIVQILVIEANLFNSIKFIIGFEFYLSTAFSHDHEKTLPPQETTYVPNKPTVRLPNIYRR